MCIHPCNQCHSHMVQEYKNAQTLAGRFQYLIHFDICNNCNLFPSILTYLLGWCQYRQFHHNNAQSWYISFCNRLVGWSPYMRMASVTFEARNFPTFLFLDQSSDPDHWETCWTCLPSPWWLRSYRPIVVWLSIDSWQLSFIMRAISLLRGSNYSHEFCIELNRRLIL